VIVYFLLKITEVAQIFGLLFPCGKRTALMLIKMVWATFGRFFSQTHLVTLQVMYPQSFVTEIDLNLE
jgi:hypothetical protein